MAWIRTIADDDAEGMLKRIFEAAVARAGRVFNITRVMSLNPTTLKASTGIYRATILDKSPLSRAQRELLATVVSSINDCHY